MGKTRLALAVAGRAAGDARWVELAGVGRAEDVPGALIQGLGVEPLAGETAADALLRFLAPQQLLLVVDNLEHVLDAAPLLGRVVSRAPEVTVLATSREPLRLSAERCLPVAPLTLDAATALFRQAASRHDPGFESTSAVDEICRRLDGLPLAIELAAARASLFSVEELAGRLDDTLLALGRGPRDAPDRQRTLRATIEWSHRLLSAVEQRAFAAFSVFAGGADLEAAERVTEANLDDLAALVAKQLLRRDNGRLAMLETVREFALERLDPGVRARHARHYLGLAEAANRHMYTGEEPAWTARLDREADNLHAAVRWSIECEPVLAVRLAASLSRYWYIRATGQGAAWLQAALTAAGDQASTDARARAQLELSFQLSGQGRDGTEAARAALRAGPAGGRPRTRRHGPDRAGLPRVPQRRPCERH